MQRTIFTIGHSTHSAERFISLLEMHGITAVGDVRSKPYSRMNPQFNREDLKHALNTVGIAYVFLGRELGARSEDPYCYEGGKVQYERLALTEQFRTGLRRVQEGMKLFQLALMCAEKEPLDCHRTVLVARQLTELEIYVKHIHADGSLETQDELSERLVRQLALPESDMFRTHEDVVRDAFRLQEARIAYTVPEVSASASLTRSTAG